MENAKNNELRPEPIMCHGSNDWDNLTLLRDGMFNNLTRSIFAEMEQTSTEQEQAETMAVFNAVSDITKYRERYLIRRINKLEQALGLSDRDFGDDLSPDYYAGNISK